MIDRAHVGRIWPPWEVEIEKGRLRLFAKAIGETRSIYTDESAARVLGYRSIVAPPTFAFCLLADNPSPTHYLDDVGIPIRGVLHGEQTYAFHEIMCAGDRVRVARRVDDIYEKKGGALEFIVFESEVRQCGTNELIATGRQVMVCKRG